MELATVDYVLIVFYGVICITGTIGNGFIVKWFGAQDERKKAGNKLVAVLAVNEIVASICIPLPEIYFILMGKLRHEYALFIERFLCHALPGAKVLFLTATAWLLMGISIERFRYELDFLSYKKCHFSTCCSL